jgi:hypothetical protein
MNATTKITPRTAALRLAPQSSLKLATCATLSLIITLLTASVIGQATGAASFASAASSGVTLSASLR